MAALALHHKLHSSSSLNEIAQPANGAKHSSQSTFIGGMKSQTSLATSVVPSTLHTHPETDEGVEPGMLSLDVQAHTYDPLRTWDADRATDGRERTSGDTLRRIEWETKVRKKIKFIRAGRIVVEFIFGRFFMSAYTLPETLIRLFIAGWAIATTVLYLLSFSRYQSLLGASFALALGASSTFAFGLLVTSAILSLFSFTVLTSMHVSTAFIDGSRRVLGAMTSFFVGAPALINLALVIIWRDPNGPTFASATGTREVLYLARCHWDVDIIWSGPTNSYPCYRYGWGVWLAAALVRAIVTLGIIVCLHVFHSFFLS